MGVYQEYIKSKGENGQDENQAPKEAAKDGEAAEEKA